MDAILFARPDGFPEEGPRRVAPGPRRPRPGPRATPVHLLARPDHRHGSGGLLPESVPAEPGPDRPDGLVPLGLDRLQCDGPRYLAPGGRGDLHIPMGLRRWDSGPGIDSRPAPLHERERLSDQPHRDRRERQGEPGRGTGADRPDSDAIRRECRGPHRGPKPQLRSERHPPTRRDHVPDVRHVRRPDDGWRRHHPSRLEHDQAETRDDPRATEAEGPNPRDGGRLRAPGPTATAAGRVILNAVDLSEGTRSQSTTWMSDPKRRLQSTRIRAPHPPSEIALPS